MESGLFKLAGNDVIKGLVTAVLAGVVIALAGIVQQPGFDVFTMDWLAVGHTAFNAGIVTLVAYLGKNFFSNNQGQVLGAGPKLDVLPAEKT